ncbi:MAG: hypothetical protein IJE43_16360 [Alphaproteobacteria bacterium]|nr:hypothetical protein [Alphaproteobacteria bacterium]
MKKNFNMCASIAFAVSIMAVSNAFAVPYRSTRLSPQNFNKMYYLATQGKVGILREAVGRGLNIDAVNPNGDTGLCIAVKRRNKIAYNTFRMSGANPRHPCTYKIYRQYEEFLDNNKVASTQMVIGNEESLGYYVERDYGLWPWIIGGAVVGGGALALSGGGSSGTPVDPTIIQTVPNDGLTTLLDNHTKVIDGESYSNILALSGSNPDASKVVDKIKFLPNITDNYEYLNSFIQVENGGYFENALGGSIVLGDRTIGTSADGAIGIAVEGKGSNGVNEGYIKLEAYNGAIGMAASGGASVSNSPENKVAGDNSNAGKIDIIFRGNKEGDTVIGMYADTSAKAVNYGRITGTTTDSTTNTSKPETGIIDDILNVAEEEAEEEKTTSYNSGTILGMALFDFYTGTDYSNNTVLAENRGKIKLTAGYNSATDVAVSLIGMGSYIDDKFLNGNNNPAFAEHMELNNIGDIDIAYQGAYKIANTALKLGDGGLIGMRADASSTANNLGDINIDMQATTIASELDVAAGMLSVHGAELNNAAGGKINILNEATAGGVSYGMLAAKGDGSQTSIYKWSTPKLTNNGIIDMQVSNSYAVATFAGGDVINDIFGTINLGVESGQSYYKNNYGLYAEGSSVTEKASLINKGIINVFSENSTAIHNAFSGSVDIVNSGTIYVSNKATNSKVVGGNFSKVTNTGSILYKVGNSALFTPVGSGKDDIDINAENKPIASVISVSSNSNSTKQTFENLGEIVVGEKWEDGKDYGGTYVTAAVAVTKQGSAFNRGDIVLDLYKVDNQQFNVGMWMDSAATAESYMENYGNIDVKSTNSIGMRNDSTLNSTATNYGVINTSGSYSYGMAGTAIGAIIENGTYETKNNDKYKKSINVTGDGAIGMYLRDAVARNYGTIYLKGDNTTAFQLSGPYSRIEAVGNIVHDRDLSGITYYWTTNDASVNLDVVHKEGEAIDGYTLAKATTDNSGGKVYISQESVANVKGQNSRLLVADGEGSEVYNKGTVNLDDSIAIEVKGGAKGYHDSRFAKMTIDDDTSIGMYATDEKSTIEATAGSTIDVTAGQGMRAENLAIVNNAGVINVSNGAKGIYLTDGGAVKFTQGKNSGTINVSGNGSVGIDVDNDARFENVGYINVSGNSYGVMADGVFNNTEAGNITVNDGVGIYAVGGSVVNDAKIVVNSSDAYGIYNVGAIVENNGDIDVVDGVGVDGSVKNYGYITVSTNGTGVNGRVENHGEITAELNGIGVYGSGSNSGAIYSDGYAGVVVDGSFTNNSSGTISGAGEHVVLVENGLFRNNGTMSVTSGTAVEVNGGSFSNVGELSISTGNPAVNVIKGSMNNSGTITIGSGTGIRIGSGATGSNGGLIVLSASGTAVWVENGGSFTNSGKIQYNSKSHGSAGNVSGGEIEDLGAEKEEEGAQTSSLMYVESGAEFVNKGTVDLNNLDVDFNELSGENGNFVVAKDGSYEASSFKGQAFADADIAKGSFDDVYVNKNSFVGEDKGLEVVSKSYMFDATKVNTQDGVDVELNRKKFEDIIEDKEVAEFFETNYGLQNNVKMFDALKSATSSKQFDATLSSEKGDSFYASLPRENMAVLRGLNTAEQGRILNDGINETVIGADYYRTGKNENNGLSGYDSNVYSPYISFGNKLNKNWSMGTTLRAGYVDTSFDEANSSRDNLVLMAFMPILYQNSNFKFLTTPSLGAGYGKYERGAVSGNYEADTLDLYYGLYNHAEYSVDVKVAELVAEAELNLQGSYMSKADEDEGFTLKANNTLSMEAGIGFKLRKNIELAKKRSLMLAIGTKYYHEFLDPYDDLDVGAKGSAITLRQKGYDEDKNRIRTSAEAIYKDGDFSVAAEIAHNAEKESSVEGGLGVRYSF